MASIKNSISFKNATITFEEDGKVLITEVKKDDTLVYNLMDALRGYDKVDGISLSISKDNELPSIEE
jgi:hypothetical protein